MHALESWLGTLPPVLIYLVIAIVVAAESLGVPVPGEIVLVSGALMATRHILGAGWVATAGTVGAMMGGALGYALGRRGGRALLERIGRRFPRHLGPAHLARAELTFERRGPWAVFFGRFVALLRILAGLLAGALRMPYPRFLVANAAGAVTWACATTFLIFGLGRAAERWLQDASWIALVVAVLAGVATTLALRWRARRVLAEHLAEVAIAGSGPASEPAGPAR